MDDYSVAEEEEGLLQLHLLQRRHQLPLLTGQQKVEAGLVGCLEGVVVVVVMRTTILRHLNNSRHPLLGELLVHRHQTEPCPIPDSMTTCKLRGDPCPRAPLHTPTPQKQQQLLTLRL